MSFASCDQATPLADLDEPLLAGFGTSALTIRRASGDELRFSIYVADSPSEQQQGLMFVEAMPADVGMLFLFGENRQASMWMKNTLLPLDMLFVRANGEIESIAHKTTPESLKSVRSQQSVCCVLELNAGTSERLGIEAGDVLLHPRFTRP